MNHNPSPPAPAGGGGHGGQAPKKIEAYQCNLCPAVFGFKFNAKRHFQKLHPEDEYDGSKIANIKFKCYGCQWGFDTYGNLESHFAQVHQGQTLNPEKVYLGDTQTTAATFQSVKRMKTPSKRKRPASAAAVESHGSRPPSTPSSVPPSQPPWMNVNNGTPPDRIPNASLSSYQGDLLCNSCDFTSDNPQSLALHQQTHMHFNHEMQPSTQPSLHPQQQQQHYYGAHPPTSEQPQPQMQHDPFMDFKAEEQQYQQNMYQQHQQQPYHHQHQYQGYQQQQQQGYQHYPPQYHHHDQHQHHQGYNNQYQQYHHYSPSPHHQVPHHPQPPHTPPQPQQPAPIMSPHQQYTSASPVPSQATPHQQPPQYHEVPTPHFTPQSPAAPSGPPQPLLPNSYAEQHHHPDMKTDHNEALINSHQNGGGASVLGLADPHHNLPQPQPHVPNGSGEMPGNGNVKGGSSGVGKRRTNIGKMFQTHICFVCESKLAKLDCIKMHFKNKHPETQLDLNRVLISRVVCYVCGVRKKEYAILVRHFQVEHKDQDIDPFRIGMDEPRPFNLSPEEEADLMKLPIPEPVKHDLNRKMINKPGVSSLGGGYGLTDHSINENTMDSLDDEMLYQLPTAMEASASAPVPADSQPQTPVDAENNHHTSVTLSSTTGGSVPRKRPRLKRAFKNNKCRNCGKAFSRITTVKKHFLDHHPDQVFDRSKVEVIKLPCYLCDTMITDARHALRHFESAHPGQEYDALQVQVSGVEFTNGTNDLDESAEAIDDDMEEMEQAQEDGFRCFLCNFWCSKIEDFQAHFAPETKAHENVSQVTIICPVCMHKCETTEDMFDHVTKEHGSNDHEADHSSSSLQSKAEQASTTTVNNVNCVETC